MHYFGSHVSISQGLTVAAKLLKKYNGNIIQIFLSSPRQIELTPRNMEEMKEFKSYLDKNNMKVVVHASYLYNIARNWDEYSWWIIRLQQEIEYCHHIGAELIVLHFGKSLNLSKAEAYNNMLTSLLYIHKKTEKYNDVKILLETSTGQGTELCWKLEDLAYFYKKISKNNNKQFSDRIKLCIDTCHIFSAGYDISTKLGIKGYLEAFEELIGIRHVKLIHLNDCKVKLAAHVDRHENIGDGYIGLKGLKLFFNYFKKNNIPIILETPNYGFKKEIKLLTNNIK